MIKTLLTTPGLFLAICFATVTRADIYEWEYINLADPGQGKQQSSTLVPDGAGVDAVSGTNLQARNLTMAYLIGTNLTEAKFFFSSLTNADLRQANLTNADFRFAELTNADLSQANLTNADFSRAKLSDTDLTGAEIRGADFEGTTSKGFAASQLYSTASYQVRDLTGIDLSGNDLTGWDFSGQNLTNAGFNEVELTNADLTGAEIRGAEFSLAWRGGLTAPQLYSTASYQIRDLTGINLRSNDLSGWNFAGQNLTNAGFSRSELTGADLTGADLRGALGLDLDGAVSTNLIRPDGTLEGLNLLAGQLLLIRDYDGNPDASTPVEPLSVTVRQQFILETGGNLQLQFEADAWDSTISFEPGIPVSLGGTLSLDFAADVELGSQGGRTFSLFDWTGVVPTGEFTLESPYHWDLSELYSTGEVTFIAVPEPSACLLLLIAQACTNGLFGRKNLRFSASC